MVRLARCGFGVLATLLVTAATAQVVVEAQEKVTTTEYKSPMVLELPLTLGESFARGSIAATQTVDLSEYVCDGVSLRFFQIEALERKKKVDLTIRIGVYNDTNHDKKADVKVQILRGEERLGDAERRNIDAEEGKLRERKFTGTSAPIPEGATLKVMLTVRPD